MYIAVLNHSASISQALADDFIRGVHRMAFVEVVLSVQSLVRVYSDAAKNHARQQAIAPNFRCSTIQFAC